MARAAGAGHIVVLIDNIPAGLVAAFDRLRADGIDVDIARDTRDAADRIHPEEQLLLICDGVVSNPALLKTLVENGGPRLLVCDDALETSALERIDAQHRWVGIALLDGGLLRQTVSALGDWTLAPTLLRVLVQAAAIRHPVANDGFATNVRTSEDARIATLALASKSNAVGPHLWDRRVAAPLMRRIVPMLLEQNVPTELMVGLSFVLPAIAVLCAAMGWLGAAAALILVCAFPVAAGLQMASVAARESGALRKVLAALILVMAVVVLAAGARLWISDGRLVAIVCALWAASEIATVPSLTSFARDPYLHAGVLLAAALLGWPLAGIGAIIALLVVPQLWNRLRAQ